MSNCEISSGFGRGCKVTSGGLRKIYVSNTMEISGATSSADYLTMNVAGDAVSAFTGDVYTTPLEWYVFDGNKTSGEFKEEGDSSRENGTHGYKQSVTANFSEMTGAKQITIDELNSGEYLVIAQNKAGKLFLMGENEFCTTKTTAGSGKALSDLDGYTIEFMGEETKNAPEVELTALTGHIQ